MIYKVEVKFFKRFQREVFYPEDIIILAGPNNSGKTTLLQAISVWNLGVQRWKLARSEKSRAIDRTGVPLTRKDFTALPLGNMDFLWTHRDTHYRKDEEVDKKAGRPKLIEVILHGKEPDDSRWVLGVSLRFNSTEQIYVKLIKEDGQSMIDLPKAVMNLQIVHIPPFSGIGAEETRYDHAYQNLLIGQGKPGDILRNLLLEVYQRKNGYWKTLQQDIRQIFGYDLINPQYAEADPFIRIEYRDPTMPSRKAFDLASAGSGFHQVLTLLGFFYARPASILLIDEPDAHQHCILQRQIFDKIRSVAGKRNSQLIVSTHSEVILEDTDPTRVLSFYAKPHRLILDTERDQVREALRALSALELLRVENGENILYLEDESDLKILREFSKVLDHPARTFLEEPFYHFIHGNRPQVAKHHFFALQAVSKNIQGVLLLDGDNKQLSDHEVATNGLKVIRWARYEIENYLLHPECLSRFIEGAKPDLFSSASRKKGEEFLNNELPPAVLKDPLSDHDYLISTAASKAILPQFFVTAGRPMTKKDYYQIAASVSKSEIHPEVVDKLDAIDRILNSANDPH